MNRSFLRYAIVGLLGAAIHIAILTILVEWAHWDPIVSSVAGFLVVLALSYWLNIKWSFKHSPQSHRKAIFRYTLVSVMGLGLNTLIMFCLVNGLGIWYLLGQAIATLIVPIHNFLLNFYWTFKSK